MTFPRGGPEDSTEVWLAVDGVGAKDLGGAIVVRALAEAVSRCPELSGVTFFLTERRKRSYDLEKTERTEYVDVPAGDWGLGGRFLWHTAGLRLALRKRRYAGVLLLSGGGLVGEAVPATFFFQQALPFCEEALRGLAMRDRARIVGLRWWMTLSAKVAARVIVQTQAMKQVAIDVLGIKSGQVLVAEPGAGRLRPAEDEETTKVRRVVSEGPRGGRFLYVGSTAVHKNLGVLLVAFKKVRLARPEARLYLTIEPSNSSAAAPGVVPLGRIGSGAVWAAYETADVLVMPSLIETVGLPLVEAMSVGLAIVASDRPFAREVCGNAARYFDPDDADALALAMLETADGENGRGSLRSQEGKRIEAQREAADPYATMLRIAAGEFRPDVSTTRARS